MTEENLPEEPTEEPLALSSAGMKALASGETLNFLPAEGAGFPMDFVAAERILSKSSAISRNCGHSVANSTLETVSGVLLMRMARPS